MYSLARHILLDKSDHPCSEAVTGLFRYLYSTVPPVSRWIDERSKEIFVVMASVGVVAVASNDAPNEMALTLGNLLCLQRIVCQDVAHLKKDSHFSIRDFHINERLA
ncbi:hypothetical protein TNCV_2846411 [Trichonephila clavipes]|nr:hypothetical protein TNCV_2846411 [Trichonephila clavipes]